MCAYRGFLYNLKTVIISYDISTTRDYGVSSFDIIIYNTFLVLISMFIYSFLFLFILVHVNFFNSRSSRIAHAAFACIFFSNIFTFCFFSRFTITLSNESKRMLVFGLFLGLQELFYRL